MTSRLRATAALLGVLTCVAPAHADDAGKAMAEQLFQEGRTLMEQGRAAEACPKFVESARLDRAPGTLFNLAECYEATGRIASAWVRYREMQALAAQLGQSRRTEHALGKIAELEPKLSYLVIDVSRPEAGMVVRQDGLELGKPAWGSRLPVDPGPHEVVAEAPGFQPWKGSISVSHREVRIRVPALVRVAGSGVGVAGAAPLGPSPDEPSALRPVGITLLIVSGAATLAATGFGIAAKVENDTARREECGPSSCRQAGLDRLDRAVTYGNISTGFIIGAALTLAGGVVSLLLGHPRKSGVAEAPVLVRF